MKLIFASDIHGSSYYCEQIIEKFNEEKADKLILLGDVLYHGPRNPLPEGYAPQKVAEALNKIKKDVLAVRGNCDADVDQLVLDFPILTESLILWLDGKMVFLTHGHKFDKSNPPLLNKGDILFNGHFHVAEIDASDDFIYINPGSVSLPKDSFRGYVLYDDGVFYLKSLSGEVKASCKIKE